MKSFYGVNKFKAVFRSAVILSLAVFMTACNTFSIDTPTAKNESAIRVLEKDMDFAYSTHSLDDDALRIIADKYIKEGAGHVDFVVSYQAKNPTLTASQASERVAYFASKLRKLGMKDVSGSIIRVDNTSSQTVFSYRHFSALKPAGCKDTFAVQDSGSEAYDNYKLGCHSQSYLAQQVARPADLLGVDAKDGATRAGTTTSNYIDGAYTTGIPNAPLGGASISDIGN